MSLFHVVDDAFVVLRSKGVYRQSRVYTRDGRLYGGWAGGYIRLVGNQGTTAANVSWDEIDAPFPVEIGKAGVPMLPAATGAAIEHKPLS